MDSWKSQFIVMNREYHKNQEQLILLQAELDSIKSKKTVTTTTVHELKEMKENVRFSGMVEKQQQMGFSSQPYVSFNQQ